MQPVEINGHLTPREFQLSKLVAAGLHNKAIAVETHLTPLTVKTYLLRVYRKLKIDQRLHGRVVLARLVWDRAPEPRCADCAYVGLVRTIQAAASQVITQETLEGSKHVG